MLISLPTARADPLSAAFTRSADDISILRSFTQDNLTFRPLQSVPDVSSPAFSEGH
jgi:hypothetical protein